MSNSFCLLTNTRPVNVKNYKNRNTVGTGIGTACYLGLTVNYKNRTINRGNLERLICVPWNWLGGNYTLVELITN